jgi:Tfp pilus assembly ATPase PilU
MSNATPNETETPHQRKIRLQNERRRRQSEQRQQEREQQRLEQQEHAVIMQMSIALRSIHAQTLVARHDCGSRSAVCSACRARMWLQERVSQSTMTNIRFTMCCNDGAVQLPLLQQPPEIL